METEDVKHLKDISASYRQEMNITTSLERKAVTRLKTSATCSPQSVFERTSMPGGTTSRTSRGDEPTKTPLVGSCFWSKMKTSRAHASYHLLHRGSPGILRRRSGVPNLFPADMASSTRAVNHPLPSSGRRESAKWGHGFRQVGDKVPSSIKLSPTRLPASATFHP